MDGHPCPLFSLHPCLFKWPALRSLQPVRRSRVNRVSPYPWLSALMFPEGWGCHSALLRPWPSPCQPGPPPPLPPRPLTPPPLHPLCSNSSQLQPSHLSVHPYICLPRVPAPSRLRFRCSLTHSHSQSAVNLTVSTSRRTHTGHIKSPPVHSVVWSDRLNRVLIEFRYIFIIADNHYTRYLQSLWNITIGIYRNFVQNMPDFNAWIVGSLFSHFWRTKLRPKSHWCLEVP